ncbi:MAG: 4Fe-4S binding protein [Desulfosalsimonas sp.]
MAQTDFFRQLAESVGAGESENIRNIFANLVNEDEASILLAAAPPATVDEISEKTGIKAEDVEKMIPALFAKGLIFKSSKKEGPQKYYRVRHVPQLHDSTAVDPDVPAEVLKLWKDFMENEWSDYSLKMDSVLPGAVVRVLPIDESIEPESRIMAPDDVRKAVENAASLAVTRCSCRVIDGKCGKPLEVCIQLGRAADYAVERGTGRRITAAEAVEILDTCRQEGLVHVADNRHPVGHVICNCCDDCCMNWPAIRAGAQKWVVPSRFAAVVDPELCEGCETCMESCFFDAIVMVDDTARVDPEACMGCGVCAVNCPSGAISLKEVRPADFIPQQAH